MHNTFVTLGDSNLLLDTSFGVQTIDVLDVVINPGYKESKSTYDENNIGRSWLICCCLFTCLDLMSYQRL